MDYEALLEQRGITVLEVVQNYEHSALFEKNFMCGGSIFACLLLGLLISRIKAKTNNSLEE